MSRQYDFTKGSIFKQLVFFSGPIILANMLQTSYQLVDSLWIGNLLGADALGAVAISSVIIFTMLAFVIGINNASLTILSQQKGRSDETGLKNYLNAFVVVLTIISVFVSIVGFLMTDWLLQLLGTPDDIFQLAKSYLQINFIGALFLFGYNFISTVLRALGDSKTPLIFVATAVSLNVILDPLFIAVFNFGIQGAAYATILSQGSAFIFGLLYVLRKKLAPFQMPTLPKWTEVKLILNLGIPAGLQMAVISAGSAAIMSVVTKFGSGVVGGYSAAQTLDRMIMLPAQSIGIAVNSMAGQNIGIKQWQRVHRIAKIALLYAMIVMFSISTLVFLFPKFLVSLFIRDEASVAYAVTYLKIIAFCFPLLGINFILNGVVRASGAMYQVLVLNLISFWILRFPLTYLFSEIYGEIGIPIGLGTSFFISSILASLYYKFGGWQKKEIFKKQDRRSEEHTSELQ